MFSYAYSVEQFLKASLNIHFHIQSKGHDPFNSKGYAIPSLADKACYVIFSQVAAPASYTTYMQ